jgi:hypothetical protein
MPQRSRPRRAQSRGRGGRRWSPLRPRACGPRPCRERGSTGARPMARTPWCGGSAARPTTPSGGVVGWPTPSGPRNRVGRSAMQTGTSNQGRWRRRTTASRPCRSRISRPQWRHRVQSRVLSTWMSQCPSSVLCVERTRPSGPCSGTCRLASIAPLTMHRCRDHLTRVLPRSMRPVAHHGSSGRAKNLLLTASRSGMVQV